MKRNMFYRVYQLFRYLFPCSKLFNRPTTNFCKYWFNHRQIIGCEVGVARGLNSLNLLCNLNFKKLYLVDGYGEFVTHDGCVRDFSHMKHGAIERLSGFNNKIEWVFKKSYIAFNSIKEKLDFCYLDGSHVYDDILVDLKNFYPYIKPYGILGGHDYNIVDVRRAVNDFFINKKLYLYVDGDDWWIVNCRQVE